jgi:hypothetical protein
MPPKGGAQLSGSGASAVAAYVWALGHQAAREPSLCNFLRGPDIDWRCGAELTRFDVDQGWRPRVRAMNS